MTHGKAMLFYDGVWEPRGRRPGADAHPVELKAGPLGVSRLRLHKPPGQQAALPGTSRVSAPLPLSSLSHGGSQSD